MGDKDKIPDSIIDISQAPSQVVKYRRGKFLGKGGFAKCYELRDEATDEVTAGKIVPKSLINKRGLKEKLTQEITLHKSLNHKFIVKLLSYFQDNDFVYINLELCDRGSLMELHKRRKAITEPETKYFLNQIIQGVQYLHALKIIHRDLKLGNIFLNRNIEIKLGDFGLATRVESVEERKHTLCGTPNYIAPEILKKKGHSFEADIWSVGCILYTLLVGKPPFETNALKETYQRIVRNEYNIPKSVSENAKNLIKDLLQLDPELRPGIGELMNSEFMKVGSIPSHLPLSCLSIPPRFESSTKNSCLSHVQELTNQINAVLHSNPTLKSDFVSDEIEDPKASPIFWITQWVDYSGKYGFGYTLCDESVGIVFRDKTKLLRLADKSSIYYIHEDGSEDYHTISSYPSMLQKKMKILHRFTQHMDHLAKAGSNIEVKEGEMQSRNPSIWKWFRTTKAVVMILTNGTMQVNFFEDHSKIILCPLLGAVTVIDGQQNHKTFSLQLIQKYGCCESLAEKLGYAREKLYTVSRSSSSVT